MTAATSPAVASASDHQGDIESVDLGERALGHLSEIDARDRARTNPALRPEVRTLLDRLAVAGEMVAALPGITKFVPVRPTPGPPSRYACDATAKAVALSAKRAFSSKDV